MHGTFWETFHYFTSQIIHHYENNKFNNRSFHKNRQFIPTLFSQGKLFYFPWPKPIQILNILKVQLKSSLLYKVLPDYTDMRN